jgi:methyl-accepting chemotaxis protein
MGHYRGVGMHWSSISVSRKLGFSMGAIIIMVMAFLAVADFAITDTLTSFTSLVDNEATTIQRGGVAKISLLECRRNEKDVLYNDDESLVGKINAFAGKMLEEGRAIEGLVRNTGDSALMEASSAFLKNAEDYQRLFKAAAAAPVGQDRMRASIPMRRAATAAENQLNSLLERAEQRIQEIKADTDARARRMKLVAFAVGLAAVGLAFASAVLMTVTISRPLHGLHDRMNTLANGALEDEVPYLGRGDEIGAMAKAVNVFRENGQRMAALQREQEESKARAAALRRQGLLDMATQFENTVKTKVTEVMASSTTIRRTSNLMAVHSESSGGRSVEVGEAARLTRELATTVSAATQELAASVNEIAQQVTQSTTITREAVDSVSVTSSQMDGLARAVQSIGEIVSLISDIAAQTNLLALNATIEAARAGEAGKGFAVVANEVKHLATQTARATEDITRQVQGIQASTRAMSASISNVADTIASINQVSSAIASAVQEQEATTQEIAQNIDRVALQAENVTTSVTNLAQASVNSSAGTIRVVWAARSLNEVVTALDQEVGVFLDGVRANAVVEE